MYPDDLALPKTLYQDDALRPYHFQAMVKRLKDMKWLIEPKTFEAGCRRVWRGYLACITQVDYALGQLMDYVQQSGLASSTIVLYRIRPWRLRRNIWCARKGTRNLF